MRNFVITVNGKTYQVGVEEVGGAPVSVAPTVVAAPVAQPVAQAVQPAQTSVVQKAAQPAPANGEKVLSPFPGLIKGLLVEEGATVAKDQPILVLEAMKMDNDITAPCAGVVRFQVVKGANVESDAVLAVIS